ncbi:serine hydrolase [Roseibium sp. MMSF_3412]|uniref:serine hydrolase domain-containing protein n=1 Tax=Roseibium sp. MMSF_3412 TaxID=3046712 RepID=UPI00273FF3D8|nr:serine hydrolase domain-containing protein [Roseibium sp. MMSF_3412]
MPKFSIVAIRFHGERALCFMVLVLWMGIAVSCSALAAGARTTPSWQSSLEGFVDGLITTGMDQDAVAGAVVVIVSGDDVLLSKGYRLGDARTGRLMTPDDDVVPLASVTKVFTALAILRLARESRLALNDRVSEHLSGLKLDQQFGDMRIIHLLSHTAGLEDRYWGYLADHGDRLDMTGLDRISAILPAQVRPPEDVISYSNASFVLLGAIVARVSGQPFEAYLREAVLTPLDVDTAHFMLERQAAGTISPFHVWQAGRYEAVDPEPFPAIHTPSGGLALTATDMGRVMQALLRKGSEGADALPVTRAIADLQRAAWPDRQAFAARTLGYWTEVWAGKQVFHHGGTHFGFHTNMTLVPALDIGIFVAANGPNGGSLMALPRRVLRELVFPGEQPVAKRMNCDQACLHAYQGRYITTRRNETGLDRILVPHQTAFTVTAMGNSTLLVTGLGHARRFEAIGDDGFETPEGDTRLGFRRNENGLIAGAYLNGGIHSFDALDFWHSSVSLDSALWTALTGSLLCLTGGALGWRSRQRYLSMPVCLGVLWIGIVFGSVEILEQITQGNDLAKLASPGAGMWTMTVLHGTGAASLLLAAAWLLATRKERTLRAERLALISALPLFVWSLFAAWKWNLPMAALVW